MLNADIIRKLFPDNLPSIEEIETRFPRRSLSAGAMVTRFAPSPTGFMHIGGLYMALISERIAHQSNGVFFLRIEDTDKKREVAGAAQIVTQALQAFSLIPDEGELTTGSARGLYGPYRQSLRRAFYHAFIKKLVESGFAYPCFCSEQELTAMKVMQEQAGLKPGYYGVWAKCRDAKVEDVSAALSQRKTFVIRFRSDRVSSGTLFHSDLIKGKIELPQNDLDVVIMKTDGLPTYHLAHAVDDHLMGTTAVLRGDEWLPSVPLHYQLFDALGFARMRYGHIPPINKIDKKGGKRKLSKRKDPEANVLFYREQGYPIPAVIEYLMNLANSNFEDWRREHPGEARENFVFRLGRISSSAGPLFDVQKLNNTARVIIAAMSANQVYAQLLAWASEFNRPFYDLLYAHREYWIKVFAIERGGKNARKDLAKWSEVPELYSFFVQRTFGRPALEGLQSKLSRSEQIQLIRDFAAVYSAMDSREEWLEKLRRIAAELNLAPDTKTLKQSPGMYRGHIGEAAQVLRYVLTGRTQTPDLFEIMRVLGEQECLIRLST